MPRANGPFRQWQRDMKRMEQLKAKNGDPSPEGTNIPKLTECGVCGLGVPNMKNHFQWHLKNTPIEEWPEPERQTDNGKEK